MPGQKIRQILRRDQPGRRVLGQIAPLAVRAEAIDDNRLMPSRNQLGMKIRPNKAGAAGDHDHGRSYTRPVRVGETRTLSYSIIA